MIDMNRPHYQNLNLTVTMMQCLISVYIWKLQAQNSDYNLVSFLKVLVCGSNTSCLRSKWLIVSVILPTAIYLFLLSIPLPRQFILLGLCDWLPEWEWCMYTLHLRQPHTHMAKSKPVSKEFNTMKTTPLTVFPLLDGSGGFWECSCHSHITLLSAMAVCLFLFVVSNKLSLLLPQKWNLSQIMILALAFGTNALNKQWVLQVTRKNDPVVIDFNLMKIMKQEKIYFRLISLSYYCSC